MSGTGETTSSENLHEIMTDARRLPPEFSVLLVRNPAWANSAFETHSGLEMTSKSKRRMAPTRVACGRTAVSSTLILKGMGLLCRNGLTNREKLIHEVQA